MSLELAIQANTAALHQLIAVMSAGKFMPEVTEVTEEDKAEQDRLDAQKHQEIKDHLQEVRAASQPAEEPKAAVPVTEHVTQYDKPLTYEADVLPVLHKFLVAKGKPAAESLLKKYGVDKFSKVPVAQLEDLLRDILKEMGVA